MDLKDVLLAVKSKATATDQKKIWSVVMNRVEVKAYSGLIKPILSL